MSDHGDFEALDQEARTLLGIHRPAEALEIYERAIELYPEQPVAWVNHGYTLDLLGRIQESLASFERALALDPREQNALSNKARALRQLGRSEDALQAIHASIELDDSQPGPWNILGS